MLDYIGRLLAVLWPGPNSADYEKVLETTAQVTGGWAKGKITTECALGKLNDVLKNHAQIRHCIQFEELLSGDGELAKELRSRIRDNENTGPINPDELEAFREEVELYGT